MKTRSDVANATLGDLIVAFEVKNAKNESKNWLEKFFKLTFL